MVVREKRKTKVCWGWVSVPWSVSVVCVRFNCLSCVQGGYGEGGCIDFRAVCSVSHCWGRRQGIVGHLLPVWLCRPSAAAAAAPVVSAVVTVSLPCQSVTPARPLLWHREQSVAAVPATG